MCIQFHVNSQNERLNQRQCYQMSVPTRIKSIKRLVLEPNTGGAVILVSSHVSQANISSSKSENIYFDSFSSVFVENKSIQYHCKCSVCVKVAQKSLLSEIIVN